MTGIGKYVAALIALVAMGWTWDLAHSEREVNLEQRKAIESTLQDTIVQYIKAKRPGVVDVVFQQLFSEDVATNEPDVKELLVRFRYLTDEAAGAGETTEQTFEGSVRLRSKDGETWQWMDETVRSPLIRYRKGTEVNLAPSTKVEAPQTDPNLETDKK